MKYFIVFIGIIAIYWREPLEETFTDPRDDEEYKVQIFGEQYWFIENLRYKLPGAECPDFEEGNCFYYGRYYHRSHLSNACPDGWRIPSVDEFRTLLCYFDHQVRLESDGDYDSNEHMHNYALYSTKGQNLINNSSFLKIPSMPFMEGKKMPRFRSVIKGKLKHATYWLRSDEDEDQITHVHISNSDINIHGHYFNVIDKPKKERSFCIRCVRDI